MTTAHLLADIGGTYARFATRRDSSVANAHYGEVSHLRVADHGSLAEAAEEYLNTFAKNDRPRDAVIAVASAVTGDVVRFSNSSWRFSISELGRQLGLQRVQVVNDFAAIAWSLAALTAADVRSLGGESRDEIETGEVQLVVGPGTGLGLSAVKFSANGPVILDSEAGHLGFSPRDDLERELHAQLCKSFGRVSYERILSGAGLVNLYRALAQIHGRTAELERPEHITLSARRGDSVAVQTVHSFCSIFGSFAGDAALAFGAWGGVYLAGDMLSHVFDPASQTLFRQSFEDKGRFSGVLARVPTLRIIRPDVGLLGVCTLSRSA